MAFETYQVEAALSANIAALSATPFNQGSLTASWTESDQYGLEADGNQALMHLRFGVYVVSSEAIGRQRLDDECPVRSRLVVEFTYRLRPRQQKADARLALQAARNARQAVMAASVNYQPELVNAGEPAISGDSEWMIIQMQFDVLHDVAL